MAHILMENRYGLIVDVAVSEANSTAERQDALRMLARKAKRGSTAGADKWNGRPPMATHYADRESSK